jgi:hypothetical protein
MRFDSKHCLTQLSLLYLVLARKNLENFKASAVLFITVESTQRTDIVPSSTEPANYTGSYTRVRKRIVDTEIAMHQSPRTIVTTAMQMLSLLKLTVSEEQLGGGRHKGK